MSSTNMFACNKVYFTAGRDPVFLAFFKGQDKTESSLSSAGASPRCRKIGWASSRRSRAELSSDFFTSCNTDSKALKVAEPIPPKVVPFPSNSAPKFLIAVSNKTTISRGTFVSGIFASDLFSFKTEVIVLVLNADSREWYVGDLATIASK
jgi:hypothetical protein